LSTASTGTRARPLLRRVRIDRHALDVAEAALKQPEETPDLTIGPRKIDWLRRFISEYRDTEPELAAALAQAALARAMESDYSDVFERAAGAFPGPRHDPRNLLLRFFYHDRFRSDDDAARKAGLALYEYLNYDLPANKELSP